MTIAANIGYTGVLEIDMACPDSIIAIDGILVDNNFLNYIFMYKRNEIESLSTSGAQKNINLELLYPYKINFPPNLSEQKVIAEILSDSDTEITALTQKLTKLQLLKQGMMQKLLTGKIRLI
jgi:type I restriction enzyme S subunit